MSTLNELAADLPDRPAPTHPLRIAIEEAARRLWRLQPTELCSYPTMADAKEFLQDLDAITDIVDALVLEYGRYARSHFGRVDVREFTDQLRNALDGNATFEIERAARAMAEECAA